jgi:hypothetical protein
MQENFKSEADLIIDDIELDAEIEYSGDNEKDKDSFVYYYVTTNLLEQALLSSTKEVKLLLTNKSIEMTLKRCC